MKTGKIPVCQPENHLPLLSGLQFNFLETYQLFIIWILPG